MNNQTEGKTCFMAILSCKKYKDRRDQQNLSDNIFEYKYFIGDPKLSSAIEDNDIVYLPCEDGYEFLPTKVITMLKWIYENKKFDYIFKTDDDIKFNFEKLKEIYNYISYNNIKYAGRLVSTNFHLSAYHKDKCETEIKNYLFPIQKTQYCAGGGYFINKDVVELIVKNFEDQYIIMNKEIYEDYFIGRFLNKQGIFPVGVNIQNQACFW